MTFLVALLPSPEVKVQRVVRPLPNVTSGARFAIPGLRACGPRLSQMRESCGPEILDLSLNPHITRNLTSYKPCMISQLHQLRIQPHGWLGTPKDSPSRSGQVPSASFVPSQHNCQFQEVQDLGFRSLPAYSAFIAYCAFCRGGVSQGRLAFCWSL